MSSRVLAASEVDSSRNASSSPNGFRPFDPVDVRNDFPIFRPQPGSNEPLIYLDSAASAQKPAVVIDRESEVYSRFYANAYRGVYRLGALVDEAIEESREAVRALIGAESADEIIFTSGSTMAPVRRPRISMRKLDAEMKRRTRKRGGRISTYRRSLSVSTRRASSVQRKWKSFRQKGLAPGQRFEIKPGQLKRSIHSRSRMTKWGWVGKAGMNVGMKKNDIRRAPHAAFVGLGTKRRKTKSGADRGVMPQNTFVRDSSNMAAAKALRVLESRVRQDFERVVMEVAAR